MERVLVTGGSGRLGSYVVRALSERYQVAVLDLQPPTENCTFIHGSVLDRETIAEALNNQDAVIHLAALDAAVSATDGDFMRVNVEGTWNLFDCAENAGIRKVIQCSSVAALNISRENPPRYLPIDAAHPADPEDAYGLSKLIGEKIARRFAVRGMNVICLRPSLVMQPDITYDVARLTAQADGTTSPPVASHPDWRPLGESISGSRTFIDPRDAATAFRAALEVPDVPFGIYHLSSGESYSALPTLTVVEREYGVRPELKDTSLYASDSRATVYDIAETSRQLGWKPVHHWASILEEALSTATHHS